MLGTAQHTKELNQCWQVLSKTPPRSLPDLLTDEPNQVSPHQSNQTSGTSRTARGFFSWQQSTVFSVPSHQPSLSLKTPGRYHLTLPAPGACSLGISSLAGSQLLDRYKQRSWLLAQDLVRGSSVSLKSQHSIPLASKAGLAPGAPPSTPHPPPAGSLLGFTLPSVLTASTTRRAASSTRHTLRQSRSLLFLQHLEQCLPHSVIDAQ